MSLEFAEQRDPLTEKIIGCAIEVHRQLEPGLLESAYRECVCYELSQMGLAFVREFHVPLSYKGLKLDCSYRIDLLVEDGIVVELKSVEELHPVHPKQLLTYLRLGGFRLGLFLRLTLLLGLEAALGSGQIGVQ